MQPTPWVGPFCGLLLGSLLFMQFIKTLQAELQLYFTFTMAPQPFLACKEDPQEEKKRGGNLDWKQHWLDYEANHGGVWRTKIICTFLSSGKVTSLCLLIGKLFATPLPLSQVLKRRTKCRKNPQKATRVMMSQPHTGASETSWLGSRVGDMKRVAWFLGLHYVEMLFLELVLTN